MGSSSSKTRRNGGDGGSAASSCSSPSSSFSSLVARSSTSSRRRRSGKNRGFFSSSCLGSSSRAHDSDDDDQVSDHHDEMCEIHAQQSDSESDEVKVEHYQTAKIDGSNDMSNVSSNVELDEWSRADNMSRASSRLSQAFSGRSLNRSSRLLSRFSVIPGSVRFRLGRAASVGTSRANSSSPSSFAVSTAEEDLHLHGGLSGLINRNENQHNGNLNSLPLNSASIRSHNVDSFIDLSGSLHNNQMVSAQELADNDNDRSRLDVSYPPFGSHIDIDRFNRRPGDRVNGSREHVDRNVRFGRTLSVGRLRDRVLRQSSYSDLNLSPLHQETLAVPDENAVNSLISSLYPSRSIPHSFYTSQNSDVGTSHSRESRHHDLLEHRSNFLERRRRIRSQVRALQRLGSRFENLSGHERYCILSGHHHTGQCSCRIGTTRDSNSNDDGGARASISRIVMLAEALFEVLDEIHHQSVVLSSQPSVSSIGSVPAPNEVVESLPVKVYNKTTNFQYEEVAQCYICLVEYEEGDQMRILPCHHEFHKKCIDKWLKEIHRVCPLCRGDICRSDSSSVES